MAYVLNAIVSEAALLRACAAGHRDMYVPDLTQGLGLLPISGELHDRVSATKGDTMGFWLLPGGFDDVLAAWSHSGPVAYVEADYFGGTGQQRAAVWDAGRLALGPCTTARTSRFPQKAARSPRRYATSASSGANEDWVKEAAAAGRKLTVSLRAAAPPDLQQAPNPTPRQTTVSGLFPRTSEGRKQHDPEALIHRHRAR